MFWYTLRRVNLFIITLAILTLVGFSLLRLDQTSPWAIQDFWPGWISYITELSTLNFGLSKHGVPIIDELVVVFLRPWNCASSPLCWHSLLVFLSAPSQV